MIPIRPAPTLPLTMRVAATKKRAYQLFAVQIISALIPPFVRVLLALAPLPSNDPHSKLSNMHFRELAIEFIRLLVYSVGFLLPAIVTVVASALLIQLLWKPLDPTFPFRKAWQTQYLAIALCILFVSLCINALIILLRYQSV